MQIEFQTNVGRKRRSNQDTVGVYTNKVGIVIGIVADGMGGHQAGDAASQLAVTGLGTSWEKTVLETQEDVARWLVSGIQKENREIYEEGNVDPEKFGMGTTVVAVVMLKQEMLIAHVGDSRGYIIRDQVIKQLTSDHSLVNELVKTGEITSAMAEKHPKKNVLLRSVGVPGEVDVDITSVSVKTGDYILLCSDGLSNMLSDSEMKYIVLKEGLLSDKVAELVESANEAGGSDNITVLLIDVEGKNEEGEIE